MTNNNTYITLRLRCNYTATSLILLSFGVAFLPRRPRRAHRGDWIEGPARGTRGRLIARHVIYGALESAVGKRAVGPSPPRPASEYRRTSSFGGGAPGTGKQPRAGSKTGGGLRASAGAGLGRSTDAGFGASYGSPLGADPRTACRHLSAVEGADPRTASGERTQGP